MFNEIALISWGSYLEKSSQTCEQIWTHAPCFKAEGPGGVSHGEEKILGYKVRNLKIYEGLSCEKGNVFVQGGTCWQNYTCR